MIINWIWYTFRTQHLLVEFFKVKIFLKIRGMFCIGGVAVGTVCNLLIGAYGALFIGMVAGLVSVVGYRYLTVMWHGN